MNHNAVNNMRPPVPPQHFPPPQMGAAFNGPINAGQQPRPVNPNQHTATLGGSNPQLEAMANQLKKLNLDAGPMGMGRGAFGESQLHHNKIGPVDRNDNPLTYEGWTLRRAKSTDPEQKLSWTRVSRSQMHLSQDDLAHLVKEPQKKKDSFKYSNLSDIKRKQVDTLVEDRKREDNDQRFDWTVAYVKPTERKLSAYQLYSHTITLSLDIVLARTMKPGISLPPRSASVFKNGPAEPLDLNILHEQKNRVNMNQPAPDMQFSRATPPFPTQNNQFQGMPMPPVQRPEQPQPPMHSNPGMVQGGGFPAGQQRPFNPQAGGFAGGQIPPPPQLPAGVEVLTPQTSRPGPPPQHHPMPKQGHNPPPQFVQEPRPGPPPQHHTMPKQGHNPPPQFVQEPRRHPQPQQMHQKGETPLVINNNNFRKQPSKDRLGVEGWLERESSIEDAESLFDIEDDSSVTDGSLFSEDHEKHISGHDSPPRQRRHSNGHERARSTYRVHRKHPVKYPVHSNRRQHESRYSEGSVDIIPERGHYDRPGRLSRSATVSYPSRISPNLGYEGQIDRVKPVTPRSPVAVSPQFRLNESPFRDERRDERDWDRAQQERERRLGMYVMDARLQEAEERQHELERLQEAEDRQRELERLQEEEALRRRVRDLQLRKMRLRPEPPIRLHSFEQNDPLYLSDRMDPVYRMDRTDQPDRLDHLDRLDRPDRFDRLDLLERNRRSTFEPPRRGDYLSRGLERLY
ncbi:hypothetical protein AJ80_00679 [Polytolypa hystricis UAMH7299]|uniref:Uncharacterized protein n=1 Tax=Polytolypa hystricis (strain UAMH7299) TaxID=1447883 RepID=A0A2B7YUC9_POLH7|nr:hypothetical protein AJ80_00679 [Polytolypa hystricis UAMH7299]